MTLKLKSDGGQRKQGYHLFGRDRETYIKCQLISGPKNFSLSDEKKSGMKALEVKRA